MAITEAEFVEAMPFLATWEPPELVPRFVAAVIELESIIYTRATFDGLIGVIIIEPDGPTDVRVLTKERCAEQAKRNRMDAEEIAAILSPTRPGTMDLLILAGRYHVVIGMPATLVKATRPGSENN